MNTIPTKYENSYETPSERLVSSLMRSGNPAVYARLVARTMAIPWEKLDQLVSFFATQTFASQALLSEEQEREIDRAQTISDSAFKRCGSPIEEVFLAALVAQELDFCWRDDPQDAVGFWHGTGVVLKQQAQIGNYRVDFLLEGARSAVIELDGHAFHERTKAQAERDKSRDRAIQARGLAVLRFAGSEIWRDPMAAARQAYAFVGGPA